MKINRNSLTSENHGITVGFDVGENLGISILTPSKLTTAQIETKDVPVLVDFLCSRFILTGIKDYAAWDQVDRLKEEIVRLKSIIEDDIERMETLKGK